MAQLGWTVLGNGGRKFKVGLYHGEESGHLVVHCNSRILLVDFGVKASKSYSFFLDDDLIELKIEQVADGFRYACELNTEADTPLNRQRQAVEKKHWRWVGWVALSLVAFIALAIWLISPGGPDKDWQAQQARLLKGEGTIAKMRLTKDKSRWRYSFLADDKVMEGRLLNQDTLNPFGFSLQDGDELQIRYLPGHPKQFVIDWGQPTPRQLQRYSEWVGQYHQSLHPDLAVRQIRCQLQLAYDLEGLAGLAAFMQQVTPPSQSPDHNRDSYLRLIRSPEFKQGMTQCL